MKPLPLVCAALLIATQARAQEAIATAGVGAPPAAEATPAPKGDAEGAAIGAWAHDILEPPAEAPKKVSGCTRAGDGKPHGEVWGAVGTGGYREVGGVVTKPIGDCATLTVGISQTQGGYGRMRGRR